MTGSEQIQSQIQRTDGVGEGARGDRIDASGGYIVDGVDGDAAACFQPQPACIEGHRLLELADAHVVEQNEVDSGEGEEVSELFEGGGFELNAHTRVLSVNAVNRLLKQFQITAGSKVIVFDHHRIIEPQTMVDAATSEDGFFFNQPPARCGFAGVPDFDGMGFDSLHVAVGHGGDAGQPLQKVQGGALCCENGAGAALDFDQGITSLEALAIGKGRPNAEAWIDFTKHSLCDGHASDNSRFAGGDAAFAVGVLTDEVVRSDVSAADVFSNGGLDQGEGRAVHEKSRLIPLLKQNASTEVRG